MVLFMYHAMKTTHAIGKPTLLIILTISFIFLPSVFKVIFAHFHALALALALAPGLELVHAPGLVLARALAHAQGLVPINQ